MAKLTSLRNITQIGTLLYVPDKPNDIYGIVTGIGTKIEIFLFEPYNRSFSYSFDITLP